MSIVASLKRKLRRFPRLVNALKRVTLLNYIQKRFSELEAKMIYGYLSNMDARLRRLEEQVGLSAHAPSCLMNDRHAPSPSLTRVISQAATYEQFREPDFARICTALMEAVRPHRKLWEYVYIIRALEQEGMLAVGRRGLGFGVGKDPMVPLMVKAGCELVATDLGLSAAVEAGWATTNQYSQQLEDLNERGLVSQAFLAKRVTLREVNMNEIPSDLQHGQFDFVWSACAFEHLGSIENGLRFVMESLRCLKPGGVAVHTTELNVTSDSDTLTSGSTVLFRRQDFEELARRVRAAGGDLELNFNIGDRPMDKFYDVPPYSETNHLKLQIDRFVTTSFGLLIRKL
jgi:SAM-dependent methyltransferase